MSDPAKNKRFGLTSAEFDNLMQAIRYGVIIVAAVLITFLIVATVAGLVGYQPPQPSSQNEAAEATPETSMITPLEIILASGL